MVAAFPLTANLNPEGALAYGSGHIDPIRAANVGIVLESTEDDYVKFLCGEGVSQKQIQGVTNSSVSCPKYRTPFDLNYPSIMISSKTKTFSKTFRRTFTNLATGKYCKSTYKFTVQPAKGITIKVTPSVISFSLSGEKRSVSIQVSGSVTTQASTSSMAWSNGAQRGNMKISSKEE